MEKAVRIKYHRVDAPNKNYVFSDLDMPHVSSTCMTLEILARDIAQKVLQTNLLTMGDSVTVYNTAIEGL